MSKQPSQNSKSIPNDVRSSLNNLDREESAALDAVWQLTGLIEPTPVPPEEVDEASEAFRKVLSRSTFPTAEDRPARKRGHLFQNRRWKAVGITTLLLFALLGWLALNPHKTITPIGELAQFTLPDGTAVTLQGGASLQYPRLFFKINRSVQLSGQAFFDVKPADHAFSIETANARVRVLGTSFSVGAWEDDIGTETTVNVFSGIVHFAPKQRIAGGDTLRANQMSRLTGTTEAILQPKAFNPDVDLLWTNGGIGFSNKTLEEIVKTLARRFNARIDLRSLTNEPAKITWIQPQLTDLESALTDICEVTSCRFRVSDNVYVVEQLP